MGDSTKEAHRALRSGNPAAGTGAPAGSSARALRRANGPEALVRRAQAGDKEAFGALVKSNQDAFYRTAWAILRNDHDAADALQEAVLYCWQKLDALREPRYFRTWATRIVMSKCYDVVRTRGKCDPVELVPERAADDAGFAQAEWQQLLSQLDERSRLMVVLHYVDGFKVAEIAQMLNANENTVKTWLATARHKYERLVDP